MFDKRTSELPLAFILGVVLLIQSCNPNKETPFQQSISFNPRCDSLDNDCYFGSRDRDKPNVILFITDDLSWEDIGYFGEHPLTPTIDKFIDEAVIYPNTFSPSPACTPARYSILTGRYAGNCKHQSFNSLDSNSARNINWNSYLGKNETTIHKVFGKNGYSTCHVGKWHLSPNNIRPLPKGISNNMDIFSNEGNLILNKFDQLVKRHIMSVLGCDTVLSPLWGNAATNPTKHLKKHHPEWLSLGNIKFLNSIKKDVPFFLSFASTCIHGPSYNEMLEDTLHITYTPEGKIDSIPASFPDRVSVQERRERSSIKSRAYGRILLEDQFNILVSKLKEMGIYDNTILVFVADHNIEPGKGSCYDSGVKTPMIIKWINSEKRDNERNISLVDIMPTVLDQCKIIQPKTMDGQSFASDDHTMKRDDVYLEFGWTRGVRTDKYKYIAFRLSDTTLKKFSSHNFDDQIKLLQIPHAPITMSHYPAYFHYDQLYDLELDPYEQHNLAFNPKYQRVLQDMKTRLKKHLLVFDDNFDLDNTRLLQSTFFQSVVKKTQKIGDKNISWSHSITWPPKKINFPDSIKTYSPWGELMKYELSK